ncbi:MAG: RHS repeat protein [Pirellulaceae bacterium]|nr:RHS repeat protein [Pirellulaceae bacterium]
MAIPPARTVDRYVSRYIRLPRIPFPCFLVWICLQQIQAKKQVGGGGTALARNLNFRWTSQRDSKPRDPNGVGYDAVYDELVRMTSQTDTFGDSTSMTYDKGGNVKTRTDAKGIVTTMVYDAQNRLISTTDRLGGVTLHNYNCCRKRVKKGRFGKI